MIDFKNPSYLKLHETPAAEAYPMVSMMLIDGETIFAAFKTTRNYVIFTDKRVISINVQGMTGKKKDYTSLPYSKVQAFSGGDSRSHGSGRRNGIVVQRPWQGQIQFKSKFDILTFNKLIGSYIL